MFYISTAKLYLKGIERGSDVYDYQGNYAGYISNGLVFDNQNYQVGTVQGGIIYNNNNFQIGSIQNGTIYWD